MKKLLIALFVVAFAVSANAQQIKKCVEIKEKKLPNYKVQVIKTNNCVEPKEITVAVYIVTDWNKKKRKKRKKRKNK
tara:strand:- start:855 stop:1085 length:231 start_codon:yes stop_codon:yes gene_type:complete